MGKPRQRRKPQNNNSDSKNNSTMETNNYTTQNKTGRIDRAINKSKNNNNNPSVSTRKYGITWSCVVIVILITVIVILVLAVVPWNDDDNNRTNNKKSSSSYNDVITNDDESSPSPSSLKRQQYSTYGTYELLETIPHDTKAFTQGLITVKDVNDNNNLKFYEGTGMNGQSQLRLLDYSDATVVLQSYDIPEKYFGEGIAHYFVNTNDNDNNELRLLQLTWLEKTAFEYVLLQSTSSTSSNFLQVQSPISNFTYETTTTQGWGITYNPTLNIFYVSDGSDYIHIWDGKTRKEIQKIQVVYQTKDMKDPVKVARLNELEYDPITDTILSNVWGQDVIVRIDPITGFVINIYDMSTLYPRNIRPKGTDVFNGIALTYDLLQEDDLSTIQSNDQVWVTGKYWPNMYRIRLIDSNR